MDYPKQTPPKVLPSQGHQFCHAIQHCLHLYFLTLKSLIITKRQCHKLSLKVYSIVGFVRYLLICDIQDHVVMPNGRLM